MPAQRIPASNAAPTVNLDLFKKNLLGLKEHNWTGMDAGKPQCTKKKRGAEAPLSGKTTKSAFSDRRLQPRQQRQDPVPGSECCERQCLSAGRSLRSSSRSCGGQRR